MNSLYLLMFKVVVSKLQHALDGREPGQVTNPSLWLGISCTHTYTVNTYNFCFVYDLFISNKTYEHCMCDNTCHCSRD